MILYILLAGYPPFDDEDGSTAAIFKQIKAGAYEFQAPYWDPVSQQARAVVSGLMTVDVKERMTAEGVFASPWIAFDEHALVRPPAALHGEPQEVRNARRKFKGGVDAVTLPNCGCCRRRAARVRQMGAVLLGLCVVFVLVFAPSRGGGRRIGEPVAAESACIVAWYRRQTHRRRPASGTKFETAIKDKQMRLNVHTAFGDRHEPPATMPRRFGGLGAQIEDNREQFPAQTRILAET